MAFVLVDFQNAFFNLSWDASYDWLVHELNCFVTAALQENPDVANVRVRLYGSWLEDGLLTKKGSLAQQAIAVGPSFPIVAGTNRRLIGGDVSLALGLLELPEVRWHSFLKRQQGLGRKKAARSLLPRSCLDDKRTCPVLSLQHFSSSRTKKCLVEDCEVRNCDAFETTEQKMVDTTLACDLLGLSVDERVTNIIVVCGDVDLIPPIISSAAKGNARISLRTTSSEQTMRPYEALFSGLGVAITRIEAK